MIAGDEAAEAAHAGSVALLEAMRGRFDEARGLAARSVELWDGLGLHILTAKYALPGQAMVELAAGEPKAAEPLLERVLEETRRSGDLEPELNAASLLGEALLMQGRHGDAESVLASVDEEVAPDAIAPRVRWRRARARLLSLEGDHASACEVARGALSLTGGTDDLVLQGSAHVRLGEVLSAAGEHEDAARCFEQAAALFRKKGDVVSAAEAERLLEAGRG